MLKRKPVYRWMGELRGWVWLGRRIKWRYTKAPATVALRG